MQLCSWLMFIGRCCKWGCRYLLPYVGFLISLRCGGVVVPDSEAMLSLLMTWSYWSLACITGVAQLYGLSCFLSSLLNASSSGEIAMKSLMKVVGHAENPMLERIGDLSPAINVSFIYGKRSWNDSKCGVQSQEILGTNRATVDIIEEANHHVYGFDGFNELVKGYCSTVEAS